MADQFLTRNPARRPSRKELVNFFQSWHAGISAALVEYCSLVGGSYKLPKDRLRQLLNLNFGHR